MRIAVSEKIVEDYQFEETAHLHLPRQDTGLDQGCGIFIAARIFELRSMRCSAFASQRRKVLLFDFIVVGIVVEAFCDVGNFAVSEKYEPVLRRLESYIPAGQFAWSDVHWPVFAPENADI